MKYNLLFVWQPQKPTLASDLKVPLSNLKLGLFATKIFGATTFKKVKVCVAFKVNKDDAFTFLVKWFTASWTSHSLTKVDVLVLKHCK